MTITYRRGRGWLLAPDTRLHRTLAAVCRALPPRTARMLETLLDLRHAWPRADIDAEERNGLWRVSVCRRWTDAADVHAVERTLREAVALLRAGGRLL